MSHIFWILAAVMLAAAVAFVALPMIRVRAVSASPVALLSLLIPATAVGLYALLGSPEALQAGAAVVHNDAIRTKPATGENAAPAPVASLVDGLRARLESEPDDADGWMLLARSYQHLDRPGEALYAYRRAEALGKSDQQLAATLDTGDSASAAVHALRGRVALSPEAAGRVLPGDTVFVFAKASRNERMPVVALRKLASELPFEFVLSDKNMMTPGGRLSDFESLLVTAKISRSGNAADTSEGLEAWSGPVSPASDHRIDLLIVPGGEETAGE